MVGFEKITADNALYVRESSHLIGRINVLQINEPAMQWRDFSSSDFQIPHHRDKRHEILAANPHIHLIFATFLGVYIQRINELFVETGVVGTGVNQQMDRLAPQSGLNDKMVSALSQFPQLALLRVIHFDIDFRWWQNRVSAVRCEWLRYRRQRRLP